MWMHKRHKHCSLQQPRHRHQQHKHHPWKMCALRACGDLEVSRALQQHSHSQQPCRSH